MPKTHEELKKLVEESIEQDSRWRSAAMESYGFYTGRNQWIDSKGIDRKGEIEAQDRPAMQFNIIIDKVHALVGLEATNRSSITILPMDDKADPATAEILGKIHKHIDHRSEGEFEMARAFYHTAITGRGWIDSDISTRDDIFGEVLYGNVRPLAVFYDRAGEKYDQTDWEYVGKIGWYSLSKAKALWPDFSKSFDEQLVAVRSDESAGKTDGARIGYGDGKNWAEAKAKRVRVVEVQYREYERSHILIDLTNGQAKRMGKMSKQSIAAINQMQRYRHIEYVQPITRTAILTNKELISDEDVKVDHPHLKGQFSLMPLFGYYIEDETFGIVENLKDPQRERNVRRSQLQNFLGRLPGIVIQDEGALIPSQTIEWLKENISKPGTILIKKVGKEIKIERLPELAAGWFQLEQESKVDAKEISGIVDALLGTYKSGESGTAINLRRQGGLITVAMLFDNLRRTKKALGRRNIGLVQEHYTTPRKLRITGDTNPLMIENSLSDRDVGIYDAIVDEGQNSPTNQLIQWEIVKEFEGLFRGMIPPDIIMEAAPLPATIKDRMKAKIEEAKANAGLADAGGMRPAPLPVGAGAGVQRGNGVA